MRGLQVTAAVPASSDTGTDMEIIETIKEQIENNPVILYTQ